MTVEELLEYLDADKFMLIDGNEAKYSNRHMDEYSLHTLYGDREVNRISALSEGYVLIELYEERNKNDINVN